MRDTCCRGFFVRSRFLDYFVGNGWLLHACRCCHSIGSSGMNSINIMCHKFIRTNGFSMLKILERPLVHNFDLNSSGFIFCFVFIDFNVCERCKSNPASRFSDRKLVCRDAVLIWCICRVSLMTDNSELLLILNNFRCLFCRLFCIFVSFIKKINSPSHNAFDWCLHSIQLVETVNNK